MVLEGLSNGPEVTKTLTHLFTIDIHEAVVHPIPYNRLASGTTLRLENLGFVVREPKIMSATMNVKLFSKVIERHG